MNSHAQPLYNGIEAPDRYTDHRFDRSITRDIKALETDNWHGPGYIVKDYAMIATLVWLVVDVSWWFYPLAVIMIGAHQRGISTILHDPAHGVLTKNRLLNFLLGTWPTAWPILQRHIAYDSARAVDHRRQLLAPDAAAISPFHWCYCHHVKSLVTFFPLSQAHSCRSPGSRRISPRGQRQNKMADGYIGFCSSPVIAIWNMRKFFRSSACRQSNAKLRLPLITSIEHGVCRPRVSERWTQLRGDSRDQFFVRPR
ncbi:hypothetical protein HFN90_36075 [Rhizobium laguerreae]|nr:hypothetical protein [Rhizobium laguerreae]MBY3404652.1 hypothetical protein [Rhizobium laguerreae]MBY3411582.1 hypothetical protein [Rhizobium laguerreae]